MSQAQTLPRYCKIIRFVCIFAVLDLLAYIFPPCRAWILIGLNLPSHCPSILVSVDIQSLTWAPLETVVLKWTQAAPSVPYYSINSAESLEVLDLEFVSIASTAF